MNQVTRLAAAPPKLSRRSLLIAAASAACMAPKAQGYRGYCLVANQSSRSVSVIDLSNFRLRKQIALDGEPTAILAKPSQPKAFVLAPEAGTVYEIDAATLTMTRKVRAGDRALGMAIPAPNPDASQRRPQDALWVL